MSTIDLKQRLDQLPEAYRLYVLSDLPRVISDTFAEFHKLDENKTLVFENGLTLYLLFFLKTDEFVDFIVAECGIEKNAAQILVSGIHAALPDEIRKIHEEISTLAFEENTPIPTPSQSVQADLAEIEKTMHQINPVRTMATDGKQIGYSSIAEDTYSSSQSSIIDKNK